MFSLKCASIKQCSEAWIVNSLELSILLILNPQNTCDNVNNSFVRKTLEILRNCAEQLLCEITTEGCFNQQILGSHLIFTCLESAVEKPEQCVKSVQS